MLADVGAALPALRSSRGRHVGRGRDGDRHLGAADSLRPVDLQSHDGYEWFYVLSGRVRLRLAEQDLVLAAGEAAEFDTRVPHWLGSAGAEPAGVLSVSGPQGERIHTRAGRLGTG